MDSSRKILFVIKKAFVIQKRQPPAYNFPMGVREAENFLVTVNLNLLVGSSLITLAIAAPNNGT